MPLASFENAIARICDLNTHTDTNFYRRLLLERLRYNITLYIAGDKTSVGLEQFEASVHDSSNTSKSIAHIPYSLV